MCRRQYHSRSYSSSGYPVGYPVERTTPRAQRIGDAERDAAASELSEHYALGRLDADEFGRRLDSVLAARTGSDLEPVFADLPRGSRRRTTTVQRRPGSGRPATGRPVVPPVAVLVTIALAVGAVAAIAGGFPPFFLFALLWVWRGHRHVWR